MNLGPSLEYVETNNSLTTLLIEYDKMLKDCNFRQGQDLAEWKEKMEGTAEVIRKMRKRMLDLRTQISMNHWSELFINNPLP